MRGWVDRMCYERARGCARMCVSGCVDRMCVDSVY